MKGNHSLSLGVWVQRVQQNLQGQPQFSAGTISYPTLTALLQDRPLQLTVAPNTTTLGYRSTEAAWYVQDEIKLKPNLTLRLGLRDEMTSGWSEVTVRCSNYDLDQNGVTLTDPFIRSSCLKENNAKALWQPRVGLAWDPTGTGTWAVRAAFGIHNDL
jgi:outer membrane receptor protein involved in Fe transport